MNNAKERASITLYIFVLYYSTLNGIMKRKTIYVYIDEINPIYILPYTMCYSYEDTANAIVGDDMEIHTMQAVFLSHKWILAGYDVVLRTNNLEYVFDMEWLSQFDTEPYTYYILDLYLWGHLPGEDDLI